MTDEGEVLRIPNTGMAELMVRNGLKPLGNVSSQMIREYNEFNGTVSQDLKVAPDIIVINAESLADEAAVKNLSAMICAPAGLTKLASVAQVLLRMTGANRDQNTKQAIQLLSWLKSGKKQNLDDYLNKFGSMVDQVIPAMKRAVNTPPEEWNEVGEKIISGGGMKHILEAFANTPLSPILEVAMKSMVHSLEMRYQAEKVGRLKNDILSTTKALNPVVDYRSKEYQELINKFKLVKLKYRDYQKKFEQLQMVDQKGLDDATMLANLAELSSLSKSGPAVVTEYHKLLIAMEIGPSRIDEARLGLLNGMRLAETYAMNQARFERLAMQYQSFAILRIYQVILTLAEISNKYCEQIEAKNYQKQTEIIKNLEKTIELVAQGRFEELMGGNTELGIAPAY